MTKLTQVRLGHGDQQQVAWIPTDAAVLYYEVELKEDRQFWTVLEVYDFSVDKKMIEENSRNYLSHRKGTDV